MRVLVGDVGGTNTRFAIAQPDGNDWRFEHLHQEPTVADTGAAIASYLKSVGAAPGAAAFCGAGPLLPNGSIRLVNSEVLLEPDPLARAAGVGRAILVNDFAAIAHAVPELPAAAFRPLGTGRALPAYPRVVLGPGTGLGIAVLAQAGGGWTVIPGEGGHADLAPVDDEELQVWQRLRGQGRVSMESVLSGPGLARLYASFAPEREFTAPQVADAAWRGDETAARALRIFTRWLGRVAGNLALTACARGGVYLAGGIVPAWGARFDAKEFRAGFEDKAPHSDWLRAIPAFVVQHPQPGLYGLAVLAADAA